MFWGLSRLPAPNTTIAARGELRLSVEIEACDEKLLDCMRVRSESFERTRMWLVSLARMSGEYVRPAMLARAARCGGAGVVARGGGGGALAAEPDGAGFGG